MALTFVDRKTSHGDFATQHGRAADLMQTIIEPPGGRRAFSDPHWFVPDRTPNDHLTFGWGIHFCLGEASDSRSPQPHPRHHGLARADAQE